MIHISRPKSTAAALSNATISSASGATITKAEFEREEAVKFFARLATPSAKTTSASIKTAKGGTARSTKSKKDEFKFRVYKDDEIAAQLRSIFHDKCAYCDSEYRHVTSTDIEHYRPKGEVIIAGKRVSPGYYWLAADWNNLLPSCPHCNRSENYDVAGRLGTRLGGKGSEFPLSDESKRIRRPSMSTDQEERYRLLLNPCLDKPEDLLRYLDDGSVLAKPRMREHNRRRAEESIRVFGLFRADLVTKRREKIWTLEKELDAVDDASTILADMITEGSSPRLIAKQTVRLQKQLEALKKIFEPGAPYLGLVRQRLRDEIAANSRAARLRSNGVDLRVLLPN